MRVALLLGVLLLTGCRSALRPPPAVHALIEAAGGAREGTTDSLLADAERRFAEATIPAVREAVRAWLSVAIAEPDSVEAWVGASRGQLWLSDRLGAETDRREAATAAVQTAQLCLERQDDARCVYRLAVALGAQARERRSTGLDALPRMVELLERAIAERPEIDRAGPDRVLALVYLRAPGWPTGPGDPDLGLEHAEAAVARDGSWPPNWLALAEAREAVDDAPGAAAARDRAAELAAASDHPDRERWAEEAAGGR